MATPMIDKYRKILAADPASMVFVELAKALLDKGRLDEAIECCKSGLFHHPDSIVGYVLWGRALIDLGRPDEAMDQFDQAMAIDPDNPYAYNLIGEALLHRRLYRSALPVLRRAVSLQPGDRRVRQWLAQAEKAAGAAETDEPAATAVNEPTVADTADAFDSAFDQVAASSGDIPPDDETTEVALGALDEHASRMDDAPWDTGSQDADETQIVTGLNEAAMDGHQPYDDPHASAWPGLPATAPPETADHAEGIPPFDGAGDEGDPWAGETASEPAAPDEHRAITDGEIGAAPSAYDQENPWPETTDTGGSEWPMESAPETTGPRGDDDVVAGMTGMFQALEEEAAHEEYPWDEKVSAPIADEPAPTMDTQEGSFCEPDQPGPDNGAVVPPPLPPTSRGAAAPEKKPDVVEELYGLELPPMPDEAGPSAASAPNAAEEEPSAEEPPDLESAEAAADDYERELREKMLAEGEPKKGKKGVFVLVGGLSTLVVVTAVIAFVWVTITGREEAVRTGLESARNGIARDTYAGYLAALDRLSDVMRIEPENTEARALAATAEAILYSGLDPAPERRARAESLLEDPAVAREHPDWFLDARYHLASDEEREEIGEQVGEALESRADNATLHYLAGLHNLAEESTEEATEHFAKTLDLQAGHARTVLALADHAASVERWEDALTYFDNARENYPGHGRAEIGAARARVALDREIDEALAAVLELERDHEEDLAMSERLQLHLVAAELEHRTGESEAAVGRLRNAMSAHPEAADISMLLARIHFEGKELDSALTAIERAEDLGTDKDEALRLKARVLLAWSKYEEAASALEDLDEPSRRTWLKKTMALYHAGEQRAAKRALDNTRNEEGRMLSDAAIYLALVDLDSGDARASRTVLNRAARARGADPVVEWALGRWHLEQGNRRPARTHLGNAVEDQPGHFRAHTDLARVEVAARNHDQALVHLSDALEVNPFFLEALQMLGESHLALGEPEHAKDAFDRALAHHPENPHAHSGVALALIELDDLDRAEEHARAAVEYGRTEARSHQALGLVLLAKEEAPEAVASLVQARRRDPDDPDILTQLAKAHLSRGRPVDARRARRYLEQAIDKDNRQVDAHWRLGLVLLDQDDIRDAIRSLNRAVQLIRAAGDETRLAAATLDLSKAHLAGGGRGGRRRARQSAIESIRAHDSAEGRKHLAEVYLEESRPVLARRQLEHAVELDPDNAMAHFLLGRILAEAGEDEAGREALEKALEIAPRGSHVREARRLLAGLGD